MSSLVRLVDLGQDRAAGGRDDRVLRQPPAELLGDLEAVGLGAFGVVRPQVHVDDRPAVLVGDLGAEAVDVVVVAADADHGAGRRSSEPSTFPCSRSCGIITKQRARPARRGRRWSWRGCRCEAQPTVSKPNSIALRDRDGDDAVLVASRSGSCSVVLDPELAAAELLAEPLGPHQRREAGVEAGLGLALDGQQVAVSPQELRARPRSTRA